MKIIGTGLSGLVGSRITRLLSNEFFFENLSLETGVDINNHSLVVERIERSEAPWVFHLAAYTDVQAAEQEKQKGKASLSWKVNVDSTLNVVNICRKTGKKLLYFSTDYVFDGKKKYYYENDEPNPQGWYAVTKHEGEKAVRDLKDGWLIVRIANPYRGNPVGKKDFVHKIKDQLNAGLPIAAPDDQLFVPTFADDIALALLFLIKQNHFGLYHVVGEGAYSPFEAARMIAGVFSLDKSLIKKVSFADYYKNRAPIPQYAHLKNDKIRSLGLNMNNFEKGLAALKKQEAI